MAPVINLRYVVPGVQSKHSTSAVEVVEWGDGTSTTIYARYGDNHEKFEAIMLPATALDAIASAWLEKRREQT
jgi:hypothetical protein